MSTSVSNRSFNALHQSLVEAENLSSLEHPTSQQRTRISVLLAKISALKSGVTPGEARAWELDELRKAAGLSRLPDAPRTALDADIAEEWRKFALTGECRATHIPHDRELRANEAGTQSITSTQFAAGGAFIPLGFSDRAYEVMKTADAIFSEQF